MAKKPYELEAVELIDNNNDTSYGMDYNVIINQSGKKKGFAIVHEIVKNAFNEITGLFFRDYLKKLDSPHYLLRINFIIKNVRGVKLFENEAYMIRDNYFEVPQEILLNPFLNSHAGDVNFRFENCKGIGINSKFSMINSTITLANSKFAEINVEYSDNGWVKLEKGSEVIDKIRIKHSRSMRVVINSGAKVDSIMLNRNDNNEVNLHDSLPNLKIFSRCNNLSLAVYESPIEINALYLNECKCIPAGGILRANYLSIHNSLIQQSDNSYIEYDTINGVNNTSIEGELIAYKLLYCYKTGAYNIMNTDPVQNLRVAKVKIPVDAKRVIPFTAGEPIIRADKVEVLDVYIVDLKGNITNQTTELPAYNFMYFKNIVEYYKGAIIKVDDFDDSPLNDCSAGISCFISIHQVNKALQDIYAGHSKLKSQTPDQ